VRTIDAALQAELDKDITTPGYIVKIELPGGDLLFSTGQETLFEGDTYPAAGVAIQRVNSAEATIMLINTDLSISNEALTVKFIDSPVEIRLVYVRSPTLVEAPIIFKGFTDNPNSLNFDYVRINCYAAPRIVSWSPRAFASPPTFNHLIPGGTIIGGILLEPSNG